MIAAIARHVSIVAGLSGSLAAVVPGLLLWQRLSRSGFPGSLLRYYLLEMALIGAAVFVTILVRAAAAAPVAWAACGVTGAFVFAAGATIGALYLPASGLFALSGMLAPVAAHRQRIFHFVFGAGTAAVQLGLMAAVAAMSSS
jgi:hypothetical protein